MLNKKIAFMATHIIGLPIIQYLLEINIVDFDYFIILNKSQGLKYNISGYYDFTDLAKNYNIKIYYPLKYSLKSLDDFKFFNKHKFDLIVLGGWQRLIPENILSTLSIGAIGVHGSSNFLPKGRGRSPLNWSLIEGKRRFISHLLLLKPGVDDGDIIDFYQFDINEFDDIKTLYYKNSIVTKRMIADNLKDILQGRKKFKKQVGEPTYYKKRTKEDGLIDFSLWDVDRIYNFVRALTRPYPGAFSYINGVRVIIWKGQVFDRSIKYFSAKYGEIVEVFSENEFLINCLDGLFLVTDYETENKSFKIEKSMIFSI